MKFILDSWFERSICSSLFPHAKHSKKSMAGRQPPADHVDNNNAATLINTSAYAQLPQAEAGEATPAVNAAPKISSIRSGIKATDSQQTHTRDGFDPNNPCDVRFVILLTIIGICLSSSGSTSSTSVGMTAAL